MRTAAGDLGRRMLAILVLVVAAWILFKIVIGVVAGLATLIVVVLAIFAIIWALRVL
jgi:accessory gene regulator protein AgrB